MPGLVPADGHPTVNRDGEKRWANEGTQNMCLKQRHLQSTEQHRGEGHCFFWTIRETPRLTTNADPRTTGSNQVPV